ncbi:MAG: HAMP domain-containing histidine kinase [Candidatus Liptonbacteria bacterium]|nr:HAMP domain-containing histidine kinase [Candidatus Liptonbacteria bacterium]
MASEGRGMQDAEAILYSIGEAVSEIDRSGRIRIFNRAAERLTGFAAREAVGAPFPRIFQFFHEDGSALHYGFIEEVLAQGIENVLPRDAVLLTRDGERVPVTGSAAPVVSEGQEIGAVVVVRDIRRERELEKIKLEFLSLASHQLRTPLSGTKWLIETLRDGKLGALTPRQMEYLTFIYQSNEQMIQLVQDLLTLARLEGEGHTVSVQEFSLKEFMEESHSFSRSAAERKGIVLDILCAEEDQETKVLSDRAALKTIVDTFLANAVNYSPPGSRVTFSGAREGEFAVFSVSDQGIGIPREERPLIFAKFYRASNAKAMKPDGTGLGLYIAKFLADAVGGVIQVESTEGKGSVFSLMIPLRRRGTARSLAAP